MESPEEKLNSSDDIDIFRDAISDENACYERISQDSLVYQTPRLHDNLVNTTRDLFESELFSDVTLCVKGRTFKAHRFLLSSLSSYFKGMFTSGLKETNEDSVELQNTDPCIFELVLRFMYSGTIELKDDIVQNVFEVAHLMQIHDLIAGCAGYLYKSMDYGNCLGVWKFALKMDHSGLAEKAKENALQNILKISRKVEFLELESNYLLELLKSDKLNVKREESALIVAIIWVKHKVEDRKQHLLLILRHIRLNHIDPNALKEITADEVFKDFAECTTLIESVFDYQFFSTGSIDLVSQFPRVCFNRESCMLTFGGSNEDGFTDEVCALSLQRPEVTRILTELPVEFVTTTADSWYSACLVKDNVYVSSPTEHNLWRYNIPFKLWHKCKRCPWTIGSELCLVAIREKIFVFGGQGKIGKRSVFEYDTALNKWNFIGNLCKASYRMTAVAYKHSVILFSGLTKDTNGLKVALDSVQRFTTVNFKCCEDPSLPTTHVAHAVVHDSSAILFGDDGCYVYDLIKKVVHSRPTWSLSLRRFGCFVTNNKVYIAGGEHTESELSDQEDDHSEIDSKYSCRIMSCKADSIISGEAASWFTEGVMDKEMIIDACVVAELEMLNA